jgi:anti-sigma factor RsiW
VELPKAFASRKPARAAPERQRPTNGTAPENVDELIASLAESVGVSGEPSPKPQAPRTRSRRARRARPRIRLHIRLAGLGVAGYLAAALALGVAIGILATRLVH